MSITHLFFDLGKVLLDYDFEIASRAIRLQSPLSAGDFEEAQEHANELIIPYETGLLTTTEFFQKLKDRFQFAGTVDELQRIWCEIFNPINEHIQLARELATHYPLALISNTSEAHIQYAEPRYDLFELFTHRIYSFRVGWMKPNPEIYECALQQMNARPEQSLFIDDREENVEAAKALGWHVIQIHPDTNLRQELNALLARSK